MSGKKFAKWLPIAAVALASFTVARPVSATLIFTLDSGNVALGGFSSPFAQVSVDRTDPTHATITFESETNGSGNVYLLGGAGAVGVNVNATSFTVTSISGSNAGSGYTPGPWSSAGAGNEDGWGSFNATIDSFDGYGHSSDLISFILTNSSGTWAGDSDVLTGNASGFLAAAHIFVSPTADFSADGALATGFAAGLDVPTPPHIDTPEPATLAILGLALAGLGFMRRRRAA